MNTDIKPDDLQVGDHCRASIPLRGNPAHTKIRSCEIHEIIEREGGGKIFRVATASRSDLVAIPQSHVGRGWRKA
jgi:hypothetical protein